MFNYTNLVEARKLNKKVLIQKDSASACSLADICGALSGSSNTDVSNFKSKA